MPHSESKHIEIHRASSSTPERHTPSNDSDTRFHPYKSRKSPVSSGHKSPLAISDCLDQHRRSPSSSCSENPYPSPPRTQENPERMLKVKPTPNGPLNEFNHRSPTPSTFSSSLGRSRSHADTPNLDEREDSPMPTIDEYEKGHVQCEVCGANISFRDAPSGDFTLKYWEAHRRECARRRAPKQLSSSGPSASPSSIAALIISPRTQTVGDARSARDTSSAQARDEEEELDGEADEDVDVDIDVDALHSGPPSPTAGSVTNMGVGAGTAPNANANTIYTPASTALALSLRQPLHRRRRTKRTEAERIAYLRDDPYVAQFEPFRVLCKACNKWIRLRPNSTYCSIPWDSHRRSCLSKRTANLSRNPHMMEERNLILRNDSDVRQFDADRILCKICNAWVSVTTENHLHAIQMWVDHRDACRRRACAGMGMEVQDVIKPGGEVIPFEPTAAPHLKVKLRPPFIKGPPPLAPATMQGQSSAGPSTSRNHHSPIQHVQQQPTPRTTLSPISPRESPQSLKTVGPTGPSRQLHPQSGAQGRLALPSIATLLGPNRPDEGCHHQQQQHYRAHAPPPPGARMQLNNGFHVSTSLRSSPTSSVVGRRGSLPGTRSPPGHSAHYALTPRNARSPMTEESPSEEEVDELRSEPDHHGHSYRYPPYPPQQHHPQQRQFPAAQSPPSSKQALMHEAARHHTASSSLSAYHYSPNSASREPRWTEGGSTYSSRAGAASAAQQSPRNLADLDSAEGRTTFILNSIRYLLHTTYEPCDDLSVPTLVRYLNAAMPTDKHEDFDALEVRECVQMQQQSHGEMTLFLRHDRICIQ